MSTTKEVVVDTSKGTGSEFSWEGVTYGVGTGNKSKEILKGISGSLCGGEVCAILGPSGSGKTSLLNILANRIRHKGANQRVGGTVQLDGNKLEGAELRKRIAYVMQADLLFATQTPREAMLFSAMLRLPRTMPMGEKRELVEKMLADLGLLDCADTYCGDEMIRGISGGEKKRTAIGIELVMKPELIFLDEPTSGLDSFTAQNVCRKLVELGKTQGCNILCTIHQPASEVFHAFNKTMVLYKGKSLFFGSIRGLSGGLAACGHGCPNEFNLADHALSLTQTLSVDELDKLREKLADGKFSQVENPAAEAVPGDSTTSKTREHTRDVAARRGGRAAGFGTQLYMLTMREAAYVWRNKPGLIASIVIPLLLNAIFACLFEGVGRMSRTGYNLQGHFGAVAQIFIGGMFGAAQPLLLRFPLERGIFLREYATSTYGAAPYFISKTMVELPQQFLQACLAWTGYYFITGLQGLWIVHTTLYWLSGITAASTALLVGSLAANAEVASQSAPMIFVPQLLFAGVFLPTSQIPVALRWLQWLSSLKYAVNLSVLNEFGQRTRDDNDWSVERKAAAVALIDSVDIDPDLWWFYLLMILVLFCLFRFLSILALARRASTFF